MDEPATRSQAALRDELEATRSAFHSLLDAIPDSAWDERGLDSPWTRKEELWHIAWGMRFTVFLIRNARHDIGLPKPPMFITDRLNIVYTRLCSTRSTRRSIALRYDHKHATLLSQLATMKEAEWAKRVTVFGKSRTVKDLFHGNLHHFEEHAARIRPGLENL